MDPTYKPTKAAAHLTFPKQNSDRFATNYTLGKQLGAGAFSVVYEGTRGKDNHPVAVKVVAKESTNAREMNEELSVMSNLSHDNIVNFLEIFDEPNGFHVVLERVTGGELFDRIITLQRYTEKDASSVMIQALKGLKHIHEKSYIHRDIKPENLLLSSPDPDAVIKLADFGFATLCEEDDALFETLGTPPYMAPEIVILRNENDNDPGYTKAVDIWALGVCLYILLSGIHPFQIQDEERMLQNIEEFDKIKWLGPNWGSISPQAKQMVTGMIERDSARRWTVDECLNCEWIKGNAPEEELSTIKESLRSYQAKKRFKGAIFGVVASNKLAALVAAAAAKPAAVPVLLPTVPTSATAPLPLPDSASAVAKSPEEEPVTHLPERRESKSKNTHEDKERTHSHKDRTHSHREHREHHREHHSHKEEDTHEHKESKSGRAQMPLPSGEAAAKPKRPLASAVTHPVFRAASVAVGWNRLKIDIVSGANLAAKDHNGLSDPYIKIWCGVFKFKSKIVKKSLNPQWDNTCEIEAPIIKSRPVEVECWDWDRVGGDDFMGEFSFTFESIGLQDLPVGTPKTFDFPLEKAKKKTKKKSGDVSGTIRLTFTKL